MIIKCRRVTRDDIARYAGVSPASVSYVLNDTPGTRISVRTRERILHAAAELGYVPNHSARSLTTGKHRIVAVWPVCLVMPFDALLLSELQQVLGLDGYRILNVEPSAIFDEQGWQDFQRWPIDGVILRQASWKAVGRSADATIPSQLPVVHIGHIAHSSFDSVVVELHASTIAAVSSLCRQGCRRVLYVENDGAMRKNDPRFEGYAQVLREFDLTPEVMTLAEAPVHGSYRQQARNEIVKYVQKRGKPDGIFCRDDEMAFGVYRGLCDMGIRIPGDVSLIGCDGMPELEYLETPISTIVQPVDEIARAAWQLLSQRIDTPGRAVETRVVSSRLTLRSSTMAPPMKA